MAFCITRLDFRLGLSAAVVALTVATGFCQTATTDKPTSGVVPCDELPQGVLSDEDLKRLVPDDSPGKIRIFWRAETQEDNYGYNIYRATSPSGPYAKINASIIAGEGSTNIPMDYCYQDVGLPRGQVFYYYIESVSTAGVAEVVEGTKDTKAKVKTVEEERVWLRKKAAGESTAPVKTPEPEKPAEKAENEPKEKPSAAVTPTATPKEKNPLE